MDCVSEAEDTVERDKESNMRSLALLTSMTVKKNATDSIGAKNACRLINDTMNEWIEQGMEIVIVNEK